MWSSNLVIILQKSNLKSIKLRKCHSLPEALFQYFLGSDIVITSSIILWGPKIRE